MNDSRLYKQKPAHFTGLRLQLTFTLNLYGIKVSCETLTEYFHHNPFIQTSKSSSDFMRNRFEFIIKYSTLLYNIWHFPPYLRKNVCLIYLYFINNFNFNYSLNLIEYYLSTWCVFVYSGQIFLNTMCMKRVNWKKRSPVWRPTAVRQGTHVQMYNVIIRYRSNVQVWVQFRVMAWAGWGSWVGKLSAG